MIIRRLVTILGLAVLLSDATRGAVADGPIVLGDSAQHELDRSAKLARTGWGRGAEGISSGDHSLVVLDKGTYPLIYCGGEIGPVVELIPARPALVHVAITGRRCPADLVATADTVTELTPIKHAFNSAISAQHGLEH
jgi:cob(I)alamin adenosyltransferase